MGKQEKIDKLMKERQEVIAEMNEVYQRSRVAHDAYFKELSAGPLSPINQSPSKNRKIYFKLANQHDKLAAKADKLEREIEKAGGSVFNYPK